MGCATTTLTPGWRGQKYKKNVFILKVVSNAESWWVKLVQQGSAGGRGAHSAAQALGGGGLGGAGGGG